MIITPKQPRDGRTVSRLGKLVPYMLRGKGEERCTWYLAGNLEGLDRQEDAELAVEVMEVLQKGNVRAKGNKTYHLVISFHPEDRRLAPAELEDVVRRAVGAAGLGEHQYIAVRHSEQEHEHLHVAVNKIHPETLKIHHPYKAIPAFQALASILEQELGLHRVDRTRSRSQSHRARDFEAHRGIESFSRLGTSNDRRRQGTRSHRVLVGSARRARAFWGPTGAARERARNRPRHEAQLGMQGIGVGTRMVQAAALRAIWGLHSGSRGCRGRARAGAALRGAAAWTSAR